MGRKNAEKEKTGKLIFRKKTEKTGKPKIRKKAEKTQIQKLADSLIQIFIIKVFHITSTLIILHRTYFVILRKQSEICLYLLSTQNGSTYIFVKVSLFEFNTKTLLMRQLRNTLENIYKLFFK